MLDYVIKGLVTGETLGRKPGSTEGRMGTAG